MATLKRSTRSGATRRPIPAPRPKSSVAGALGWVLFVISAGVAIFLLQSGSKDIKQARQTGQQERQMRAEDFEKTHQTLQAELTAALEEVNTIRKSRNRTRKSLASSKQTIAKESTALEERELERKKAADQRAKIESTRGKAERSIGRKREKLSALQEEHEKLLGEYIAQYSAIEAKLKKAVEAGNRTGTKSIYSKYPNSPFAPAALFFAAEFHYANKNGRGASNLYHDLLRKFPSSAYCGTAKTQIAAIEEKKPYEAANKPLRGPSPLSFWKD